MAGGRQRVDDLRRQHARAEAADRKAERAYAAGAKRTLAEPTAPALEVELTGAQRAVEVLERELVQSGRRLFAASLEHVDAARAALERRLDADDDRVEELIGQALALLDERALAFAETRLAIAMRLGAAGSAVRAAPGGRQPSYAPTISYPPRRQALAPRPGWGALPPHVPWDRR